MPRFVTALLVTIFTIGTLVAAPVAADTSITASDGIRYELAPTPPAGVEWLQPGEEREITSRYCSLDNTGWLQRQYTCTSARVVAALEPGLVEIGGITSTEVKYRLEIIFGFVTILALALGIGLTLKHGIAHPKSSCVLVPSVCAALGYGAVYSLLEYKLFLVGGAVCASGVWAYFTLIRSERREVPSPWFFPSTLTLAAALTINLAVLLMQ